MHHAVPACVAKRSSGQTASLAIQPKILVQTRPGLRGRVAAYHGDLSVQARRDVHAAFMHDRLTVGGLGVAAAGGKLVVRAPVQVLVCLLMPEC